MSIFFIVSKVGWLIIQPIGLLTLGLAVIFVASLRRKQRLVRWLAFLELAFLVLVTQTNIGQLALRPLEDRFERPASLPAAADVAGIIVLGGGFNSFVTSARGGYELNEAGDRFVEALRLANALPDVPIVISGGDASFIGHSEGDAPVAKRFFTAFGIAPDRLVLEDKSMNTYENAVFTKAAIARFPPGKWLLVTSAFHMPRSVGIFRKQGVDVIPWPVDYRSAGNEKFSAGRADPENALSDLTLAMREWVGIAVYTATGRAESVWSH